MTSELRDVAAVLIDMDGTLIDSEHASAACWTEWAGRRGKDVAAVLAVVRGRKAVDTIRDLAPELSEDEIARDVERFTVAEHEMTDGIVALDGSVVLLAALREHGVPHALVTSAGRVLAGIRFDAARLTQPATTVYGGDVRASKPDPEGFLAAAALLGVDPAACVVLEDSAAGVTAGRAAGARVIGVGAEARGLDVDAWVATPAAIRLVDASTLAVG